MLNNRRSEIDIFGKILEIAKSGARKTRILYQANMNYAQLQNYLDFLLDKGLLEKHGSPTKRYRTTERGLRFLAMSGEIKDFLLKPCNPTE